MNRDNIQATIEVLKRAKNFDINNFQGIGTNLEPGKFRFAHDIEELHACGNTACIAGYVGLSAEWADWGGIQDGGVPLRHIDDAPARAMAAYWGVSEEIAAGLIFGHGGFWSLLQRLGAPNIRWCEVTKEEAIEVFEAMLANPDVVNQLSAETEL